MHITEGTNSAHYNVTEIGGIETGSMYMQYVQGI